MTYSVPRPLALRQTTSLHCYCQHDTDACPDRNLTVGPPRQRRSSSGSFASSKCQPRPSEGPWPLEPTIFPDLVFGRSFTRYCTNQQHAVSPHITYNLLGRSKRSDNLSNLNSQLFCQFTLLGSLEVEFGLHCDKCKDCLTRDVIVGSYDGSLGHALVEDQGRFYFGGGETMARDAVDQYKRSAGGRSQ
jgi:hypothetical protein